MEKKIKQFASITLPVVQIIPYRSKIVVQNGTAVTFWGRLSGDNSGYVYTFNAFGEAKERVLQLNLKENSRVIITGFQKPFRNGNHYDFSISISAIDFCPANDDGFRKKTVESLLAGGKLSVSEIADAVSMSIETVTKIRDEMQSQTQEPQKTPIQMQKESQSVQKQKVQTIPQQKQQSGEQKTAVSAAINNDEMDIDEFLQLFGA